MSAGAGGRVDASSDRHLPPPAARRLHVRRRRGGGALPRRPRGQPPLPLARCSQAVPGSQHGYDVLDHTRVSEPSSAAWTASSGWPRPRAQHGLGLVVDVVPNHMALVAPESSNAPLWDVLAARPRGRARALVRRRLGRPRRPDRPAGAGGAARRTCSRKGDLRLGEETAGRCSATTTTCSRWPTARGTATGRRRGRRARPAALRPRRAGASSDEVLNYRRFFDVDGLIAVRVEEPDVFEATHRVLLDLNHRGIVEGFRIDHPDGLADPEGYLAPAARGAAGPAPPSGSRRSSRATSAARELGLRRHHRLRRRQGASPPRWSTRPSPRRCSDAWEETGGEPSLRARRRRRQARRWSPTSWCPSGPGWSAGPREALPDADPAGSRRRSSSCWSPARSTAPTSGPASRRRRGRPSARSSDGRRPRRRGPPRPGGRDSSDARRAAPTGARDDEPARDFAVRLQQTWGPVMAKGDRGHRVLPLAPPGRRSTRSAATRTCSTTAVARAAARVGRPPAGSTGRWA